MRLLQALRGGRDDPRHDAGEPEIATPQATEDAQLSATQAIGARQERFSGDLASISQLVAHLQQLGPLVDGLREPLMIEFEAFRRDHSDLLAARAHVETLLESVKTLRESEQALTGRLKDAAKASENDHVEIESLRGAHASALADGAQAREALAIAAASIDEMKAAAAAAQATNHRLEEDVATLRARVEQGAERRRELDAITARSRQDADLAEAENASLRHRLDELAEQISKVSRAETQLQADLLMERERGAAQLAEAERAHREALAHGQAFEAQLVTARTHAAGLSTRIEASNARSAKLEALCMELSTKANEAISYRQMMEGAAGDSQIALARAMERIVQLERAAGELKSAHTALDRARMTALERGDQLTSALQVQEAAMARLTERNRLLEAGLKEMADEEEERRRAYEDETGRLGAEARRIEAELQLSQAALKTAREHRPLALV